MLKLNDVAIEKIIDLDPFSFPLTTLLPDASLEALAEDRALLDPHHIDFAGERVLLAVQSFVLRIDGRVILIDSCVGEDKSRPTRPEWNKRKETGYLERLGAVGVRPEDVDIVLCTHLHADHVGWNTRLQSGRWIPTFPNAQYLIGTRELAHWEGVAAKTPPGTPTLNAYTDSVVPIVEAGRAVTVDNGHEIARGLTVLPTPGHTPGHVSVRLERGSERAIFCGDAIHSPAQVLQPDWSSAFCTDMEEARVSRRMLIEEAVGNDAMLIPAHLRVASAMRVKFEYGRHRPFFCGCDAQRTPA